MGLPSAGADTAPPSLETVMNPNTLLKCFRQMALSENAGTTAETKRLWAHTKRVADRAGINTHVLLMSCGPIVAYFRKALATL
jgi:hypothetical protein